MKRHIYSLNKPAAWYGQLWREALPLGNGLTGALVLGAIADEEIRFTRHDMWHGGCDGGEIPDITDTFREMRRAIDSGDYAAANRNNFAAALSEKGYKASCGTPYPLGSLKITMEPESMFKGYRRGIDMETGESFVTYTVDGCRFERHMFISRADDIAVLRMKADKPFTAVYGFDMFSETTESVTENASLYRTANDGSSARMIFLGDFTSETSEGRISVTGEDYTVIVKCGSNGSDSGIDAFTGETYASLLKKHTDIYTPLYDSVSVELANDEAFGKTNEEMLAEAYDDAASPALFERLWRFGRYLFISAASENGNPVPLYGIWHGDDKLMWSQYVANENVEMTYWHTMAGGLSYAIPALIRYYTSKTERLRECAKKMFGTRGIWLSAYTAPGIAGVPVPVAVISNWISSAGWLCRHFWDYYRYTGDEALLREEILPFMHEAALFFCDYAVEGENGLRLYPSVSPENTPQNLMYLEKGSALSHPCPAVQNATMDFAVMKELFTNLLEGMALTGMFSEDEAELRRKLSMIPDYPVNGEGAVKEWMHPDLEDNYHHRHLSHIYPVFPGTEVTAFNAPELFEAFRRAVNLRKLGSQSGWSLTHMAGIYARLGEAERAAECLDVMTKSVTLDSLMTLHNDWRRMGMTLEWEKSVTVQLDAAFGAVNAIQEMLFCAQSEALSVLPALPKRLADGTVRGIVFPSGRLDIVWDASGKVNITVYAVRDIDTAILVFGKERGRIKLSAGEKAVLSY